MIWDDSEWKEVVRKRGSEVEQRREGAKLKILKEKQQENHLKNKNKNINVEEEIEEKKIIVFCKCL